MGVSHRRGNGRGTVEDHIEMFLHKHHNNIELQINICHEL